MVKIQTRQLLAPTIVDLLGKTIPSRDISHRTLLPIRCTQAKPKKNRLVYDFAITTTSNPAHDLKANMQINCNAPALLALTKTKGIQKPTSANEKNTNGAFSKAIYCNVARKTCFDRIKLTP